MRMPIRRRYATHHMNARHVPNVRFTAKLKMARSTDGVTAERKIERKNNESREEKIVKCI